MLPKERRRHAVFFVFLKSDTLSQCICQCINVIPRIPRLFERSSVCLEVLLERFNGTDKLGGAVLWDEAQNLSLIHI
jgi:hypothetical protein